MKLISYLSPGRPKTEIMRLSKRLTGFGFCVPDSGGHRQEPADGNLPSLTEGEREAHP